MFYLSNIENYAKFFIDCDCAINLFRMVQNNYFSMKHTLSELASSMEYKKSIKIRILHIAKVPFTIVLLKFKISITFFELIKYDIAIYVKCLCKTAIPIPHRIPVSYSDSSNIAICF